MTCRCYIAAPWWHPSFAHREWNTRRAELLAALARADGFEPVCVHRDLMDRGVDDAADPAAREAGLAATCELIREIKAEGGAMFVLNVDWLVYTPGVRREMDTWRYTPHVHANRMVVANWFGWGGLAERAGLLAEWRALAVPPC